MKPETRLKLNKFKPRPYQRALFDAIEKKNIKKAVLVWHRRAGKDLCCLQLILWQALQRVGSYLYVLPTYRQARLTLWEASTNDGVPFLDFIPAELIKQKHKQDMCITLVNGSRIYFLGSDNVDRLRGTNAMGIVFSEYAFQNDVYPVLRPVLAANDGWCVFISTPNGMNHFYKLYEVAQKSQDWFCDIETVDDTGVVSQEQIERDINSGLMSQDMAQQEYYCSFTIGATGSYYSKYLNAMELSDQIGNVPHEPSFPVMTAWDLGVRDATCILFFQLIGKTVNIIDSYSNHSKGLEHYVSVIMEKGYTYGKHFAPHDIMVKEFGSGMTRLDKARNLGIKFEIKRDREMRKSAVPNLSIMDGIEAVRSMLPKIWIDETKCRDLIVAIRDYRREYDHKNKVYKNHPLHDHNSHYADCLRYLCLSVPLCRRGTTPEELDKRYREAVLGNNSNMPSIFRDDLPKY